jgi:hypothetical protein
VLDREASPTAFGFAWLMSAQTPVVLTFEAASQGFQQLGVVQLPLLVKSGLGLLLQLWRTQPTFKIGTAACLFCRPCSACTRFYKSSLPTAEIKTPSFKRLRPKSGPTLKRQGLDQSVDPCGKNVLRHRTAALALMVNFFVPPYKSGSHGQPIPP